MKGPAFERNGSGAATEPRQTVRETAAPVIKVLA